MQGIPWPRWLPWCPEMPCAVCSTGALAQSELMVECDRAADEFLGSEGLVRGRLCTPNTRSGASESVPALADHLAKDHRVTELAAVAHLAVFVDFLDVLAAESFEGTPGTQVSTPRCKSGCKSDRWVVSSRSVGLVMAVTVRTGRAQAMELLSATKTAAGVVRLGGMVEGAASGKCLMAMTNDRPTGIGGPVVSWVSVSPMSILGRTDARDPSRCAEAIPPHPDQQGQRQIQLSQHLGDAPGAVGLVGERRTEELIQLFCSEIDTDHALFGGS